MREGRDAGPWEGVEDPRMWRLLLARLHPDAGGDRELFAFACAVKEEVHRERPPVRRPAGARGEREARRREKRIPEAFLEDWQRAMYQWSARNRATLSGDRSR